MIPDEIPHELLKNIVESAHEGACRASKAVLSMTINGFDNHLTEDVSMGLLTNDLKETVIASMRAMQESYLKSMENVNVIIPKDKDEADFYRTMMEGMTARRDDT